MHVDDEWLPFEYVDFWDVPRLVFVRLDDRALILDAPFNDELDDYEDSYAVYPVEEARDMSREEWLATIQQTAPVARLPVASVEFDETRRRAIRRSSLQDLLA
jgi:hypothetical protein